MKTKDVKRWQARKIHDALLPARGYLHELRERMTRVGFLDGDPLFECVKRADDAMHELVMALHYLSHDGGDNRQE
jgi:hypothetical protein